LEYSLLKYLYLSLSYWNLLKRRVLELESNFFRGKNIYNPPQLFSTFRGKDLLIPEVPNPFREKFSSS